MRIRILVLSLVVAASSLGCAFSQWTDRYFLGTQGGSPVYADRTLTGLVLVPFALAADVVTFPVQAVVLVCGGDEVLYTHAEPKGELGQTVHPRARRELTRLRDEMGAAGAPVLVGITAEGDVRPIDATHAQVETVIGRMERASEASAQRL
jgi:hypothetical protein